MKTKIVSTTSQRLTGAQKQARRNAALEQVARSAGWPSWSSYVTSVKNGIVKLPKCQTIGR